MQRQYRLLHQQATTQKKSIHRKNIRPANQKVLHQALQAHRHVTITPPIIRAQRQSMNAHRATRKKPVQTKIPLHHTFTSLAPTN